VTALSGRGGGERWQSDSSEAKTSDSPEAKTSDSPEDKTVAGTREASVYGEAGRLPYRVVMSSTSRKDWIGSVHPNPRS
jgi:hypothetical protein